MMFERIGIIGNTQGVNVSRRPKPKKASATSQMRPSASCAAMRSCSVTGPLSAAGRAFRWRQFRGLVGERGREGHGHVLGQRRVADAQVRAALIIDCEHDFGGILDAAQHRNQDLDMAAVRLGFPEEFIDDAGSVRRVYRPQRNPLAFCDAHAELVPIQVVAVGDVEAQHDRVLADGPRARGESHLGIQQIVLVGRSACQRRECVERPASGGHGFGAGLRQCRECQAHGLEMRGVADAEVGAALGAGGQLDFGTGRRQDRQLDFDPVAIGFDASEELVFLHRAVGYPGFAQFQALRLRREPELLAVHVVAIRDGPGQAQRAGIDNLGVQGEGVIGIEEFVVLEHGAGCQRKQHQCEQQVGQPAPGGHCVHSRIQFR
jgi:hypothetical protein